MDKGNVLEEIIAFPRRGVVYVAGERMALLAPSGFAALRRALDAELGPAAWEALYRAGKEGARAFVSTAIESGVVRPGPQGFRTSLDAFSWAGFGDFRIKRFNWKKPLVVVECRNTIEGAASLSSSGPGRGSRCDYTAGVLASFQEELDERRGKRFCAEVSCVARGERVCRFIIGSHAAVREAGGRIRRSRPSLRTQLQEKVENLMELQSELALSEEKYRSLFEAAEDPVFAVDMNGMVMSANPASLRLGGYAPAEVLGRPMLRFVHPEDRPMVVEAYEKAREGVAQLYEMRFIKADGQERRLQVRNFPIRDGAGRIHGVYGIARDITYNKQMQARLKEYADNLERLVEERAEELRVSEKKYRGLFENALEGIVVADAEDGGILETNSEFQTITGYGARQLEGRRIWDLVPEGDREDNLLVRNAFAAGGAAAVELPLVTRRGKTIRVELKLRRIDLAGRPIVLGVCSDVTEKKELEQRVLQSEKLAMVGRFASVATHELRNPLNTIALQMSVLERKLNDAPQSLRVGLQPHAEVIRNEISRLDHLVRDYLQYSKISDLRIESVKLNDLINYTILLLSDAITKRNISLVVDEAPGIPPLRIDKRRMEQVLVNLLKNALEAVEPGTGVVRIRTLMENGAACVEVTDNGCGIDPDADVYEMFYTTKDEGTGLGLPIVHDLVTRHGGKVEFVSQPGLGTTFRVALPIGRPPRQPTAA